MAEYRIPVDEAHVKQYNEYFRKTRQLIVSAVLLGLITAAAAAATLYWGGIGVWTVIAAVILLLVTLSCLVTLVTYPKRIGNARKLYDDWPLVPAIVCEAADRSTTIMALVETAAEPQVDSRLALVTFPVEKLPGTKRAVGTRVPSVAVAAKHKASSIHWDEITPVPVCWATPDKAAIAEAAEQIPEGRWQELNRYRSRWKDVSKTTTNMLPLDKLD